MTYPVKKIEVTIHYEGVTPDAQEEPLYERTGLSPNNPHGHHGAVLRLADGTDRFAWVQIVDRSELPDRFPHHAANDSTASYVY